MDLGFDVGEWRVLEAVQSLIVPSDEVDTTHGIGAGDSLRDVIQPLCGLSTRPTKVKLEET